ncbi:MAG TPA: PQQ-dependent sugar dehydrogenase [Acidimicrobiia bacterium]|nr:PQQ-dependent sugar dehydrogenase [Acidimicrobiia bacterium]
MRRPIVLVLILGFLLGACKDSSPHRTEGGATASSATMLPGSATTGTVPAAEPCTVGPQAPPTATLDADNATALTFAPDGRLFFSERSGTVRVFQDGAVKEFAKVPTVTTENGGGYSERGLLGLAVSPTFAADHFVYAFVSNPDRAHQEIVRWTDCAGTGGAVTTLVQFPSGNDCCHKGGRLAFGPDGKLYATLGDEHTSAAAQDTKDPRGKVLRYNPDGTVPADNPFGAGNPVWAYGFRNPFGIAISPAGQVAITSNGPTGDSGSPPTGFDIVFDKVAAGSGHQWARCYGYSHPLPGQTGCGAGQVEPAWSSETTTVVPTGAAFVDAAGPAGMAGHLVFCTYNGGMRILTPGTPHATVATGADQCRLDVVQGPDHAVYYSDSAHIYRT